VFDYRLFVAFRYLLVNPPKTSWRTLGIWAAGIALQISTALAGVYHPTRLDPVSDALMFFGFLTFVHWYVFVLRASTLAFITFTASMVFLVIGGVITYLGRSGQFPGMHMDADNVVVVLQVTNIVMLIVGLFGLLTAFAGTMRAFFTFFTTVPVIGVFIGTSALVLVLSVMSGFESDLREKILGSNAHIQITREDGDFTEWHQVKARIDHIPGIVASTPYAVSEVVIAANNNGMNVIIKGIDPKSVGKVTELVHDLDDKEALSRLAPLIEDEHDLRVPEAAKPPSDHVVDPAPAGMPTSGDPIDFSGSADDDTPPPPRPMPVPIVDLPADMHEAAEPPAGSGLSGVPDHVLDPAPDDMVISDDPPIDFSQPDSARDLDPTLHVVDVPVDSPSLSRRTQALPGILVGRELVKQTHLFTGEEVRVVSPLSDPSNPDATGTPIPFNRDYRVAGTFYTGMYEYDLKYVYVSLDSLDEFLDRGDTVDGIEVRIGDPDDTDTFVEKLQDTLGPQYRVQDWKELNRSLFSALKLEKIAMFLVLGIVILVASFSIVGNLIMVVVEKQREIALLKTLGASDGGLMQLFAIQGLLIGLIGTALGIGVGLIGCIAGQKFGIPLNPDVYYIDRMPVHVEAQSVVLTALAGVLISIAATFYPSMLAARVRPAAGMRQ
jgi:lipoprotein-releasing system permease protein